MRTLISLFVLALFCSSPVVAQISLEGGINMSNLLIDTNGNSIKTKFKRYALAGVLGDIRMSEHIYFEPGVWYKADGCALDNPDGSSTTILINTYTVTGIIEYMSGYKCGSRALFGIGPYLSFMQPSGYWADNYLKDKDFGVMINLGYRAGKHWYLKTSYWWGLTDIVNGGDSKNSIKTMGIASTIGFKIGGCRPRKTGIWSTPTSHHWRGLRNNGRYRKERNYRHWLNY